MAYRHKKYFSPAELLAQRGELFASGSPKAKGAALTPKGKQRTAKARKEYLKAAEDFRRAARLQTTKVG